MGADCKYFRAKSLQGTLRSALLHRPWGARRVFCRLQEHDMNRNQPWAACLLAVYLGASFPAGAEVPADWEARSSALADRLTNQLKAELGAAMQSGGPAAAIEVCRIRAPEIAARLSAESGAQVSRTALRVRNPANAPDFYERTVMERFASDIQAPTDTPVAPPEASIEWPNLEAGGVDHFYMRAIVMQPQCLPCHGATLAPEVARAIRQHYPQDQATGFEPGQLRGAVVVRWPVER
jgi:hypothetical protein